MTDFVPSHPFIITIPTIFEHFLITYDVGYYYYFPFNHLSVNNTNNKKKKKLFSISPLVCQVELTICRY